MKANLLRMHIDAECIFTLNARCILKSRDDGIYTAQSDKYLNEGIFTMNTN